MYHALLLLHLLAAFALVATVVVYSAVALGMATDSRLLLVGRVLWGVGGLGTLVFGIWLALYVSGYQIYDGWIIAAIVLWAIGTELGRRAEAGYIAADRSGQVDIAAAGQAALLHWLRSVVILALLVVMIYKPGA
jgi:hypothetical protein